MDSNSIDSLVVLIANESMISEEDVRNCIADELEKIDPIYQNDFIKSMQERIGNNQANIITSLDDIVKLSTRIKADGKFLSSQEIQEQKVAEERKASEQEGKTQALFDELNGKKENKDSKILKPEIELKNIRNEYHDLFNTESKKIEKMVDNAIFRSRNGEGKTLEQRVQERVIINLEIQYLEGGDTKLLAAKKKYLVEAYKAIGLSQEEIDEKISSFDKIEDKKAYAEKMIKDYALDPNETTGTLVSIIQDEGLETIYQEAENNIRRDDNIAQKTDDYKARLKSAKTEEEKDQIRKEYTEELRQLMEPEIKSLESQKKQLEEMLQNTTNNEDKKVFENELKKVNEHLESYSGKNITDKDMEFVDQIKKLDKLLKETESRETTSKEDKLKKNQEMAKIRQQKQKLKGQRSFEISYGKIYKNKLVQRKNKDLASFEDRKSKIETQLKDEQDPQKREELEQELHVLDYKIDLYRTTTEVEELYDENVRDEIRSTVKGSVTTVFAAKFSKNVRNRIEELEKIDPDSKDFKAKCMDLVRGIEEYDAILMAAGVDDTMRARIKTECSFLSPEMKLKYILYKSYGKAPADESKVSQLRKKQIEAAKKKLSVAEDIKGLNEKWKAEGVPIETIKKVNTAFMEIAKTKHYITMDETPPKEYITLETALSTVETTDEEKALLSQVFSQISENQEDKTHFDFTGVVKQDFEKIVRENESIVLDGVNPKELQKERIKAFMDFVKDGKEQGQESDDKPLISDNELDRLFGISKDEIVVNERELEEAMNENNVKNTEGQERNQGSKEVEPLTESEQQEMNQENNEQPEMTTGSANIKTNMSQFTNMRNDAAEITVTKQTKAKSSKEVQKSLKDCTQGITRQQMVQTSRELGRKKDIINSPKQTQGVTQEDIEVEQNK